MARTKRRPYTGSKAVDKSCRGGGDCPHCAANRRTKILKAAQAAGQQLDELGSPNGLDPNDPGAKDGDRWFVEPVGQPLSYGID